MQNALRALGKPSEWSGRWRRLPTEMCGSLTRAPERLGQSRGMLSRKLRFELARKQCVSTSTAREVSGSDLSKTEFAACQILHNDKRRSINFSPVMGFPAV